MIFRKLLDDNDDERPKYDKCNFCSRNGRLLAPLNTLSTKSSSICLSTPVSLLNPRNSIELSY